MKKALIIVLLLIVCGIVGFFVYSELTVKELFFVSNFESDDGKGKYVVRRLYSSDVDMEVLNEKMDKLISLEFTDEEIMQAALDAGTPEFYPAFHVVTYRPTINENEVKLELAAVQELAPKQKYAEYSMSDIRLEIIAEGVKIKEITGISTDTLDRESDAVILKNEAGTGIYTELGDYGSLDMTLEGVTGKITVQSTYNIKKNTILKHMAMEDCFLMFEINITELSDGKISVEGSCSPASTLDEYIEQ